MDSTSSTPNHDEADAFFARFTDAAPAVLTALEAERDGNLPAITAEAAGYWNRIIHERHTRAAAATEQRQLQDRVQELRFAHPREHARRPTPPAAELLPAPRIAAPTAVEQRETRRWWGAFRLDSHRNRVVSRLRREARDADTAVRRHRREVARWRDEQRALERAEWLAVLHRAAARRRARVANRWAAIDEQRALEIALAVLDAATPPQGPQ